MTIKPSIQWFTSVTSAPLFEGHVRFGGNSCSQQLVTSKPAQHPQRFTHELVFMLMWRSFSFSQSYDGGNYMFCAVISSISRMPMYLWSNWEVMELSRSQPTGETVSYQGNSLDDTGNLAPSFPPCPECQELTDLLQSPHPHWSKEPSPRDHILEEESF